jgi:cell division protein FtsB
MEKLRRLQRLRADIDKVAERIAEDTARLDSLKAEAATLSAEI